MSFAEILRNRRSVRSFLDKKIETEKIEILKKALLMSPTGKSKNHWDFIFVQNKNMLNELSNSKQFGSKLLETATMGVVILGDSKASDTWIEDCSIASILLQLQAEELELGSCWIQIHKRPHNDNLSAEEFVKEKLNIPSEKSVLSIVALGYPAKKRAPIEESELLFQKIHSEMF